MPRSISTISRLLAGLLAWFSVGAVERSAAAALEDAGWAADDGHAALVQGSRPDQDLARPRAFRAADAGLGRFLSVGGTTLQPPAASILQRSTSNVVAIDLPCWSQRTSRGPPA